MADYQPLEPQAYNPSPAASPDPMMAAHLPKSNTSTNSAGLPRIPVDLTAHKTPLAIHWTLIILTSGLLPIVGYFALHYGVPTLALKIVLSPWLGAMGVMSLYSLGTRTYRLLRHPPPTNAYLPLGQRSKWGLDYFGYNFLFGFVVLTVLISLGISLENLTVVSLPLSILILYVSIELLFAQVAMTIGMRAPFRFSSVPQGGVQRPGAYTIVEDVVAVDGKQARAFREAWDARYEASPVFRRHLRTMDLLWGCTGLMVVAAVWGVVFGVGNEEVGYAVGWALPWLWAGGMTILTISLSKGMLRKEAEMQRRWGGSA